jgi:hypothetical protein
LRKRYAVGLVALVSAALVASAVRPRTAAPEEPSKPAYVGPDTCKRCHFKQWKSWKKTGMARSLEVLRPGKALEKKKASGLDASTDYGKDPKCLRCHVTGHGAESGYRDGVERLGSVGCEACHGPGSLYVKVMEGNERFGRTEIHRLGATCPPTAAQCAGCHARECPTMPADYVFDFERARKSPDVHEHVPLKHPH